MAAGKLPFVYANLAITADGKIAPAARRFVPFSSKRDQQLMLELRSRADAVMAGARTVGGGRVTLGPGGRRYQQQRLEHGLREFNLRVIVSRTASISPRAHIFSQRFSPILLLTTEAAPKERRARLAKKLDDVFVSTGATLDLRAALGWLREKWEVKRLLCEGGGELNASMFRGGLVNELYLTICPVLFGGRTAPTLADGEGIEALTDANRFKLKRSERFADELYCLYQRSRRCQVENREPATGIRSISTANSGATVSDS